MGSALTENGSTRQWRDAPRALGAASARRRAARCGKLIEPATDEWDLGHVIDRARGGGNGDRSRPEHRKCSRGPAARSSG